MEISNRQINEILKINLQKLHSNLFIKLKEKSKPEGIENLEIFLKTKINEAVHFGFELEWDIKKYVEMSIKYASLQQSPLPKFVEHELTWPSREKNDSLFALEDKILQNLNNNNTHDRTRN